jgi:glycosyltransferase involved in cell wall biosynthesis
VTSAPLRIAHVGLKGIPVTYGGIERVTDTLAQRMAQRGHEVTVYARQHYISRSMRYRGVDVRRLPSWNSKYTDTLSHTLLSLLDVRRRGADVVHLHSLGPALLTPMARALGLRVVVHVHGQEWRGGKWGRAARLGFRTAEWPAVYTSHELVVVSDSLRRYYQRRFRRAATCIPNGVDLPAVAVSSQAVRQLTGCEPGEYLLSVGRLVPEKGLDTLLPVASGGRRPLIVVGEPDHSAAYAAQLKRRWSSEKVRFIGGLYGMQLSQLYAACWAYVQPSVREGMSMTLLEAMAHGCRIVASDIEPNRETLGDSGSYVPVGSTAALAQALSELDRESHQRDVFRAAASRRVFEQFRWDDIVDRWERLYRRVAEGPCI